MKIKVIIPKKGKWTVSIGKSTGYKRCSASACYNLIERKLSKLSRGMCVMLKEKWAVKVEYDREYFNESLSAFDPHYLMYCLLCFLEDYLSKDFIKKNEKIYLTKIK